MRRIFVTILYALCILSPNVSVFAETGIIAAGAFFNIQSHVALYVCQMERIVQQVDILGNGL